MKIEIDTGKAKIILVKVPENYSKVRLLQTINELEIILGDVVFGKEYEYIKLNVYKEKLDLIGNVFELTEEQCRELVMKPPIDLNRVFKNYFVKSRCSRNYNWDFFTNTAKESFASLLYANKIDAGNWIVLKLST